MTDFANALESGVDLLRSLPRRRSEVHRARAAAAEWAGRHPEVGAQLVVDQRPGTPVVDYDLVLDHPGGGTVAVTAPPEDGVPWLIDHSTHWAAGHLVSVDDVDVSVSQALTMMRSLSRGDASPYREIVDQCLLAAAVDDDVPVGAADLQATADEFRRGRGLHDRAATLAWIAESGMSGEQFESYLEGIARRRRFRIDKEAELAAGHLAAHREDFARVRAVWVTGPEKVVAGRADELLSGVAYGEAVVTVGTRWASELPPALRGAAVGVVVGPEEVPGGGFLTGAVLSRDAAVDDDVTLAAAGRAAFAGWLAGRRAAAKVEWHWS
ncbi:MAG: TIGR04500 family putative peptide maturation system protein [Nonomuraea sp.]|nr:TIGR04500 family putative peptide maturation system protein [Nonomuraea sp.]NUP81919.1 TIGR04500 family putative peptide maturation system protein [Nonomuraea sp.]